MSGWLLGLTVFMFLAAVVSVVFRLSPAFRDYLLKQKEQREVARKARKAGFDIGMLWLVRDGFKWLFRSQASQSLWS